ncbi:MAG: hypothetical protein WBY44_24585 [Bryobacteraceae bacterium]
MYSRSVVGSRAIGLLARRRAEGAGALCILLLAALPAAAQINGVIINQTTGQPQSNAAVTLTRMTATGPQNIGETKTAADGKFAFNDSVQGPTLVRAAWDGVTYNKVLPPGTPSTNLTVDVYQSSKAPGDAKVSKHMILFEPGGGQMSVNETILYSNNGKTSWNDPANGTLHFYLPPDAASKLQINATAPGGMPVAAPVSKSSQPNVYKTDFPVKPGETRFDLTYTFPYKIGDQLEGKVATKDENTYLIVPNGITLTAEHVNDLGVEPRTQAHIYGLTGTSYNIQLTGAEIAGPAEAGAGAANGQQDQESGPQIAPILPRIYTQVKPILAIALGILGLGFALLYRKEAHGRQ